MFSIKTSKMGYLRIETEFLWVSDNDYGIYSNNPESVEAYYINLFMHYSKLKNFTFRVYRTAHGMRSFIVNKININNPIETLYAVNSDPMYVRICSFEKKFSFRITPKIKNTPENFSVTKYLTTIGSEPMLKEIEPIINLHDRLTKSHSDYILV